MPVPIESGELAASWFVLLRTLPGKTAASRPLRLRFIWQAQHFIVGDAINEHETIITSGR